MTRRWLHRLAPLAVLLAAGLLVRAAEPPAPPQPDLSEFRTVDTAVTTQISRAAPDTKQPAYLGVSLDAGKDGRAVVVQVDANSPAAKAGLTAGDMLTRLDGKPVAGPASVRELLAAKGPGDAVQVAVLREDKKVETQVQTVEASVALAAVSRPMVGGRRAIMGVRMAPGDADGAHIDQVTPGMPAAAAGVKAGRRDRPASTTAPSTAPTACPRRSAATSPATWFG